jgi:transposase InsO family protein
MDLPFCLYNKKKEFLSVFEYIDTWYNMQRRHSALNYFTLVEYGKLMNKLKIVA